MATDMVKSKSTRSRKASRGRTPSGGANPIDVFVGGRVRQHRTLMGLSQERLGEALGLTFQQVQKYERGANRIGSSRLYDISRVLSVPMSYFFEEMPADIAASSPSVMVTAKRDPNIAEEENAFTTRETLELVRNYFRIPQGQQRDMVLMLAKTLGK